MAETYDPRLKARLTLDDEGRVRGIHHVDEFWQSPENAPRQAAVAYLREVAETLRIPRSQLEHAHQQVAYLEPAERGTEYRLFEEKTYFDSTTEGFYQTDLNVPVWASGLTVTVKHNPTRVLSVVNTSLEDLDPEKPPEDVIERWRGILLQAGKEKALEEFGEAAERSESAAFVADMMGGRAFKRATGKAATEARQRAERARILSGRFFIYRYVPEERLPKGAVPPPSEVEEAFTGQEIPALWAQVEPTLPLPPVDERIRPGGDYVVAEIVFFYPTPEWGDINWRALVELETASVLYLRALAAHVNGPRGLVFIHDPITESGDASKGSDKSAAVLDPFSDDVALENLNAPVSGNQSLSGLHVTLSEEELPTIAAPTKPSSATSVVHFDFGSRTNEFAAVNAYYHVNRFFELVEDLGFTLSSYFDGTLFPVPVDHRGLGTAASKGNVVDAHCVGTGVGIDHLCYALAHTGDTANPIGIATDWRVHLHELAGHGILHDHVGGPNFGFCHSAGDSFALILSDPESKAPDRFLLSPFVPDVVRRCDRGVAEWSVAAITVTAGGSGYSSAPTVTLSGGGGSGATAFVPWWGISGGAVIYVLVANPGTGYTSAPTVSFSGGGGSGAAATATIGTWAWGGGMDQGGYLTEQILATTLFRIYRSIGGDSSSVTRKRFAARYMAWLLLRMVGGLNQASNPKTASAFADSLIIADQDNWTSEGVFGGAYGKVIRWSFEKQGLYQPGSPPPGSVTTPGYPPPVDVYIDDGRAGEYQFLAGHWSTTTIWNRLAADGGTMHEPPSLGVSNYAYVKIKNRGTQTANDVIVRGFHSKPAAGLLWPDDFVPFTTPQLSAGTLGANNSEEKTVGPFEWTPNVNAYGHDCMLMIVSATGDPSNIDTFTPGEVIPEWRLVPNDNNVGQRNVTFAPGGGGSGGLMAGLNGFSWWVGNPNPGRETMEIDVKLPKFLGERGWRLGFRGMAKTRFMLAPRKQQELILELEEGGSFDPADVEAADDRDIVLTLMAGGAVIGGMTYRLDPTLERPRHAPGQRPAGRDERCRIHAGRLLDCLDMHGHRVEKVQVKKVTVDITMEDEPC